MANFRWGTAPAWARTLWLALTGVRLEQIGRALAVVVVALIGGWLGLLTAGHYHSDIGPFRAEFTLTPSLHGGTDMAIPPLGSVAVDSHDGPAHLSISLGALDQQRAAALVTDPGALTRASGSAAEDIGNGVLRLALRASAVAVLGALLLAALAFRDIRRVAWSGGIALTVMAASLGIAVGTFRPRSIEEPHYRGLLVNAPAVIGDARRIANDYDQYKAELRRLVQNVSRLYGTFSSLPVYQPDANTLRVLHVSDLHLNPAGWSVTRTVVEQFAIDMVIDTGDITDWGSGPEAGYVDTIGTLKVPYVYIRGNHDSTSTAAAVARQPNAIVLENQVREVRGLTLAGIGDPRFTPDKGTALADPRNPEQVPQALLTTGEQLATTIRATRPPTDVALVHDPASAGPLAGICPLVLSGHLHQRQLITLNGPNGSPTQLMVQGSTGGAGLRGLESTQPLPLVLSVLYLNPEHRLVAYDDIRVGGAGQAEVSLERHVVTPLSTPVSPTPTAPR